MRINQPVTRVERHLQEGAFIVSTTDLRGVITSVNEEFVRVSGFTEEELIGQPQNLVRHPDMPPAAFEDLWRTIKAGRSWQGMVKNRCKNGDFYWVDASVSAIVENGQIVGYMSIRSKPAPDQVEEAERLYASARAGGPMEDPERKLRILFQDMGFKNRVWTAAAVEAFRKTSQEFRKRARRDTGNAKQLDELDRLFASFYATGQAMVAAYQTQGATEGNHIMADFDKASEAITSQVRK